ncbi:MAG: acyltransferase [Vulcanimicrobiaceae bacterium]
MDHSEFLRAFASATTFKTNPFHPLVWILGEPEIGEGVYIGAFTAINANGARVRIGHHCDIAAFVAINAADSHRRCLQLQAEIARLPITLEDHVFVGTHATIKGGAHIGHHSVVAAGTVVDGVRVPPFSLVAGNPMTIRPGYYREQYEAARAQH